MFRLDRFLTLYFFHPLAKLTSAAAGSNVPILMYHSISGRQKHGSHPYYETATSPAVFERHLACLKESGYKTISLEDLGRVFSGLSDPEEKHVVITFDDGFADFYDIAHPLLEKHGFSATVFLPAGMIGKQVNGLPCMSWDQIRKLSEKGISFGSHSMTHPKLVELSAAEVEAEIGESKAAIERELGDKIASFSYPFAFPEQDSTFCIRLEALLQKHGFRSGVTTIVGKSSPADNRFFLKRLPVNDFDDDKLLTAKLEGGYDWLHTGQRMTKEAKLFTKE